MSDCPTPLMGKDLLSTLGATLLLKGQGKHSHHQMTLTESRKQQIKSGAEMEALEYQVSGPGQRYPGAVY